MDLNHVICWLTGLSSALDLLRGLRSPRSGRGRWLVSHALVLLTLALALALSPGRAGYAALAVHLPLVALPRLGGWLAGRLFASGRLGAARRLMRLLASLHPGDGWSAQARQLEVLELLRAGDVEGARHSLASSAERDRSPGRLARLQLLRADGRWAELARHVEDEVAPEQLARDASLLSLHARSLGELGRIAELLRLGIGGGPAGKSPSTALCIAAFTGRLQLTRQLLAGPLRRLGRRARDFWTATALQAAGRADAAAALLQPLEQDADFLLQGSARQRLRRPVQAFDEAALAPGDRRALRAFERALEGELRFAVVGLAPGGPRPVTSLLVAASCLAFLVEMPGGTTDLENLIRLGALIVPAGGDWWRVVSAAFLHHGALHLALNLLGLWIIGGHVERVWGRWRMLACYLAAAIGGNLAALGLVTASPEHPVVMVGASGGVLGVLGAALSLVAVEWRRRRLPVLRRQLGIFGLVLALQLVFDASTPEVSSTIHLAGLCIGLALGAALAVGATGAGQPRTP